MCDFRKDQRMWEEQSSKEEKETNFRTFRSYFGSENCNLNRMYEHVPFRIYLVCFLPPPLFLETRFSIKHLLAWNSLCRSG